MDVKEISV